MLNSFVVKNTAPLCCHEQDYRLPPGERIVRLVTLLKKQLILV